MSDDNIEAAMDKVAETLEPTISPLPKEDDGPAPSTVLIRTNDYDKDRWKQAADKVEMSLSQFIRETLNARAVDLLDCAHPTNMRRWYPWAEFCLKCETRLR
jgi:hypothetical protein